jgi:hypothetical protein
MPKLAFALNNLLNLKKFSLSLYLGYMPIYRQRCGVKPELRLMLLVDLEV